MKKIPYSTEGKLTKSLFTNRETAIEWLMRNRKDVGYTFYQDYNP